MKSFSLIYVLDGKGQGGRIKGSFTIHQRKRGHRIGSKPQRCGRLQDTHVTDHLKVNQKSPGKRNRLFGEFAQLISKSLEQERLDKGLVKREGIIISIFRLPQGDRGNLEEG